MTDNDIKTVKYQTMDVSLRRVDFSLGKVVNFFPPKRNFKIKISGYLALKNAILKLEFFVDIPAKVVTLKLGFCHLYLSRSAGSCGFLVVPTEL